MQLCSSQIRRLPMIPMQNAFKTAALAIALLATIALFQLARNGRYALHYYENSHYVVDTRTGVMYSEGPLACKCTLTIDLKAGKVESAPLSVATELMKVAKK